MPRRLHHKAPIPQSSNATRGCRQAVIEGRVSPMESTSEDRELDYLFDLQGYLVLPGALAERDLAAMNRWLDDHWSYVLDPPSREGPRDQVREGRWIGHVELHSYGPDDGVNFQNIVEGGRGVRAPDRTTRPGCPWSAATSTRSTDCRSTRTCSTCAPGEAFSTSTPAATCRSATLPSASTTPAPGWWARSTC